MNRWAITVQCLLIAAALVVLAIDVPTGWRSTPLGAVVPPGGMSATGSDVFARQTLQALAYVTDTDEEAQPVTLPALPAGMTVGTIAQGDAIYHGKGGCYQCHGADATGIMRRGKSLTAGLIYMPMAGMAGWVGIDSLILNGMAETVTRSEIAMPMRGLRSDLTNDEVRQVAAYVWALAHVRGEPWPGGHVTHGVGPLLIAPRTTGP